MTPEAKVKKEIRAYIDSLPGSFRIPTITRGYGRSGIPDDIVCYKGMFWAIEIKAPEKHTTPWQDQAILDINTANGIASICWSLENAKQLFEEGIGWVATDIGSKKYRSVHFHH